MERAASSREGPTDPPATTSEPFELLLHRLVEVVEGPAEWEQVAAAGRRALGKPRWADRLLSACDVLGIHATELRGSVSDLVEAVGPRHPAVVIDEEGRWSLLVDRHGAAVEVEDAFDAVPRRLRPAQLAARLGVAVGEPVSFVALAPPGRLGRSTAAETSTPTPWDRLRALLRQERHDIAVVLIYAIGVGVLTLTTPVAVQALVNTVAFGTLLQPLIVLALLLFGGLVFAGVLRALQVWVVEVLQRRLFLRLVGEVAYRLPRADLAALERVHGPELLNRFFDLFTIQKTLSTLLVGGLEVVLTAAVGMLVLAFYHPLLLAFALVMLVAIAGVVLGLGRRGTTTAVAESKAKYAMAGWLEELARRPAVFKAAGGFALARRRTDALAADYLAYRSRHFRIVFRQMAGALALHAGASAGILGIGGWLVITRQLTLGQLVAAELIVTVVVASFAKAGKLFETAYDLLAALDKVGQLVDLPLAPAPTGLSLPLREEGAARVVADGVQLASPADAGTRLDFTLAPAERVALVGNATRCRVLVDTLVGFRAPAAGRLRFDDVDVRFLEPTDLHGFAVVARPEDVIAATVLENLRLGHADPSQQAVRDVLRAVGLLETLEALPEGFTTRLMPDGAPLDAEQVARLVLARTILRPPPLLVIDRLLDGFPAPVRQRLFDTIDASTTVLLVSEREDLRLRCDRTLSVDGRDAEPPPGDERHP